VVRGMCSLRPGLEGISDNIRVSSVIGRFLEHSRLFWFANGGESELFLGSADWMPRNLDRRVEAVVQVLDPDLCVDLEWYLQLYLDDQRAWLMQPDGSYRLRNPEATAPSAQQELMELWSLRSVRGEGDPRKASGSGGVAAPQPAVAVPADRATTSRSAPGAE